jgi:hypothetical protein
MNEHADHRVTAMVMQRTLCSVELVSGDWQPDWQTEIMSSAEVDESTLYCDTCNKRVERNN